MAVPNSSSTVKNTTPFALPGRWRTSTRPARRSQRPSRSEARSAVVALLTRARRGRSRASGCAPSVSPVPR